MSDSSISLNKFISQTGVCSRREADTWIEAGRVCINDVVARKGNRVDVGDNVTVDGKPVGEQPKLIYLALHKPPGITCTTDLNDRDNIIKFVNYPQRIFPIGRLDKPSSGLILMTNDGDIVNSILRVENHHEKEYVVSVDRPITPDFLEGMAKGVPILGTRTHSCKIQKMAHTKFKIILTQGLNRQIRRMCEFFDYRVVTLKRVRIMNIELGGLRSGEWRDLSEEELTLLKQQVGRE